MSAMETLKSLINDTANRLLGFKISKIFSTGVFFGLVVSVDCAKSIPKKLPDATKEMSKLVLINIIYEDGDCDVVDILEFEEQGIQTIARMGKYTDF